MKTINYCLFFILFFPVFSLRSQTRGKKSIKLISDSIRKYQLRADYPAMIPFLLSKRAVLVNKSDTTGAEMEETLELLGESFRKTGEFNEAKNIFSRCLEIQKAKNFPDKAKEANLRKKTGTCLLRLNDFAEARSEFLKALEIREKLTGKESKPAAEIHFMLGILYLKQNKFESSEQSLKTSLDIGEKISGKSDTSLVDGYNALGALYYEWGKPELAGTQYQKCVEIIENQLHKNHPKLVFPLNNQANLYQTMGNYDKAAQLYKRVLEILILQYGPNHPELADFYHNLGVLYLRKDEMDRAEEFISKSIERKKANRIEKETALAIAIFNLGNINFKLERYEKAEKLYLESVSLLDELKVEKYSYLSDLYNNMAAILARRGKFAEAENYYRQVMEINAELLGPENPNEAEMEHRIAMLYYMKGDPAGAEKYFKNFSEKEIKKIRRFFPFLSDEEKEKWVEKEQNLWKVYIGFCAQQYGQNPNISRDLVEFQLATKGLLLSTSAKWRSKMRAHPDPLLRENFEAWLQLKNKIFSSLTKGEGNQRAEIESLQNQADKLEREINVQMQNQGLAPDGLRPKFTELRSRLRPGQALVEMIRVNKLGIVGTYRDSLVQINIPGATDTIQYAALVLKAGSERPEMILFPEGGKMENAYFQNYRKAIARELPDKKSYSIYWEKLNKALKGCNVVFFSPDGIYHRINPLTLWNPASKKYLVDETDVRLITSGSDLMKNQNKNTLKTNACLMGFPAFFGKDSMQMPSRGASPALVPLLSTQSELDKIGVLLRLANRKVDQFSDISASEAILKKVKNPGILHLATHGFYQPDTAEGRNVLLNSGLMLANSGLSLAGKTAENQDDGILTAAEAMNLNLDSTELVVLSACETGLGEIKNGEGVYGMQRAIKVAGARSVVMSLWKVNDEATGQLMENFYKNWLGQPIKKGTKKNTKSGRTATPGMRAAFLAAQKQLKTRYPNPYYWGAFVMAGE